jgi:hypothetical protein
MRLRPKMSIGISLEKIEHFFVGRHSLTGGRRMEGIAFGMAAN